MIRVENAENQAIINRVYSENQEHVLRFWDELTSAERNSLISQLKQIDFNLVNNLVSRHIYSSVSYDDSDADFQSPKTIRVPENSDDFAYMKTAEETGKRYLEEGKVGAFMVAGGQGSRLGYEGPKGCFRVSPVQGKTIFQLHCEKLLALEKKYSHAFPLYIMTSDANHEETKEFFEMNDYFGLKEVHFFKQGMLPAVDKTGKLLLSNKHEIFMNPDGHGGSIYALRNSGALDDMKKKGIEVIFYFQVDNILINMLDPVFIGYHVIEKAQMSTKAVSKASPEERVGVVGMKNGKYTIIEYSVLPNNLRYARNNDGKLRFDAGNIAIHCINVDFVDEVYQKRLPYNKAFKEVQYIDDNGELVVPDSPNAYKFEMFVFDALSMADNSVTMMVDRTKEFAPVKNKDGDDSPSTAKKMMSDFYKNWLKKLDVNFSSDAVVEISPLYALDEFELAEKLKGNSKNLNSSDEIYLG